MIKKDLLKSFEYLSLIYLYIFVINRIYIYNALRYYIILRSDFMQWRTLILMVNLTLKSMQMTFRVNNKVFISHWNSSCISFQHIIEMATILGLVWSMSILGFLYSDALGVPSFVQPVRSYLFQILLFIANYIKFIVN